MNYALVIRALERHADISQRSVNFFRERRLGVQFQEGLALLEEAQRALDEVRKMRDMHEFQKHLYQQKLGPPPNPIPVDTSEEDLPPSSVEFPDKKLREPPPA